MSSSSDFQIRPLRPEDAPRVAAFMLSQPPAHANFFYALENDEAEIRRILDVCVRDVYLGMLWQGEMLSLATLRGWDAGYDIPTFGIIVDHKVKRTGVMRILLDTAKLVSKQLGAKIMMVKVHPNNISVAGIAVHVTLSGQALG